MAKKKEYTENIKEEAKKMIIEENKVEVKKNSLNMIESIEREKKSN